MLAAARLGAQAWNDARVLAMVRQATDRRVQQLTDSGLVAYQATAHGYLTFLAQLGEGLRGPPRVVKADELALEVYWRAPNLSKQRIVGRRDTTLLPTDIQYHLDHLGIIQNNFPAIIRLGEGDEVRDVPHPLSPAGLEEYDFALSDSLRITTPGRVIEVYELKVRPRDDAQPRVVGAVYLDRDNAQIVRMAFGFTLAAYIDRQLEDVFVVIENGVVGGRFWLPRHQEVEIRRTLDWMDYPVRGIIRGRWEIGNYQVDANLAAVRFGGPEIVMAPPAELARHLWPPGTLADSIPRDSRLSTPLEVQRIQAEARALAVKGVAGRSRTLLAARGASDFVRFDRNSGLSVGSGVTARVGGGWTLSARGRYGIAADRLQGRAEVGWRATGGREFNLFWQDDVRDAGDAPERSGIANGLAAQEFGSDYTSLYGVRGVGVAAAIGWQGLRWYGTWSFERDYDLGRHGASFGGALAPSFDADSRDGHLAVLGVERSASGGWLGIEWGGHVEARTWLRPQATDFTSPGLVMAYSHQRVDRLAFAIEAQRGILGARLVSRSAGGAVSSGQFVRLQDLFFAGGPVSAPGFGFHSLVGDRTFSQSAEVQLPVWAPGVGLGRFGRLPGRAWIAPHWTAIWMRSPRVLVERGAVSAPANYVPDALAPAWRQSAGVSVIGLFDVLRLDASRPLSGGRWRFSADVSRAFWGIL